jgi:hypothetical protein
MRLRPAGAKLVRPYLKNRMPTKGLVGWLKVKALSSNPSIAQKRVGLHPQLGKR